MLAFCCGEIAKQYEPLAKLSTGKRSKLIKAPDKPGPNSSDSQGNNESCILSHVCDKVFRNLLMSLIKLDF
jgi:hypothetical protein